MTTGSILARMDNFMHHSETEHVAGHKPRWTSVNEPVWCSYPGEGVQNAYSTIGQYENQ